MERSRNYYVHRIHTGLAHPVEAGPVSAYLLLVREGMYSTRGVATKYLVP